jgi:succinate dehydrogenase / fumarate reductase cytochrome b subunit
VKKAVNKQRPVNLDLTTIHFPITAIASILHRVSGVFLFAGVGFLLWALGASLESPESFTQVKECFDGFFVKLFTWAVVAALIYHLIAGCKHLLMDLGIGEDLESGQLAAKITLAGAIVLILLAGVWIW